MSETDVYRAIAHPARREIIGLLADQSLRVSDIASTFDMTRPAITKHLNILRAAGLVRAEKHGRDIVNTLDPAALQPVEAWIQQLSTFWESRLAQLRAEVERPDD